MRLIALALTFALLAGCSSSGSSIIEGDGSKRGDEIRKVTCKDAARIIIDVSGTGPLSVAVIEGGGQVVFVYNHDGSPQDINQRLQGASGTWKMVVEFGSADRDFTGTWDISLVC